MKIYRCVIGLLMAFFIIVGVWYVVSCCDERRSIEDGLLIWNRNEIELGGEGQDGTNNCLYQG